MAKQKKDIIINYVNTSPVKRDKTDIRRWREAIRIAESSNKNRKQLFDIYNEIMLDAHLNSVLKKRIMAITNKYLYLHRDGDRIKELDNLINMSFFRQAMVYIMESIFYGFSLIELDWPVYNSGLPGNTYLIPRENVKPEKGIVTVNHYDTTGIDYTTHPWALFSGDTGFGLLNSATPYVLWKRGNFGDWADFNEVFGKPFAEGKYDNDPTRELLTESFKGAGFDAYVVAPKDAEMKIHKATTSDEKIFLALNDSCNQELSILILGQTMTTEDGSSRSQSETHKKVEESINLADMEFVLKTLDEKLLPILKKLNYPVDNAAFDFEETDTIPLAERINIDIALAGIVPIDLDYFYTKYGIPKPENNSNIAKPQSNQKNIGDGTDGAGDNDKENLNWVKKLRHFFFKPLLNLPDGDLTGFQNLSGLINLSELINHIAEKIKQANGKLYFDAQLFNYLNDRLIEALRKNFAQNRFQEQPPQITVDYATKNDAVATAMEINIAHFSAAKTIAEIMKLNEAFRKANNFEEFKQVAAVIDKQFNQKWAETEYETAALTAESTATYWRMKRNADIMPYWKYNTVGDNRVRYEHRKLDGLILPASDERWDKIYPPNGWRCRCYVTPLAEKSNADFKTERDKVENFYQSKDFKTMQKHGFDVNRAKTAQVFTANQMYIRGFKGNEAKYLNKLNHTDYGLKEFETLIKTADKQVNEYKGTAQQWWEQQQKDNEGNAIIKDHRNRYLLISPLNFKEHTSNKKEKRNIYLNEIENILQKPDEVWINDNLDRKKFENLVYIKYFKAKAIVACANIKNEVTELKSWFELRKPELYRYGLLIK